LPNVLDEMELLKSENFDVLASVEKYLYSDLIVPISLGLVDQ
jgi:hypothetical protein